MIKYEEAGVSLEGADRHVERIAPVVTETWNDLVRASFGGFAAGIRLPSGYRQPVLMMTTDGVGTKLELARRTGRWDGVGYDLAAMVIDDLAAVGARPLALVDYMAVGALDPDRDRAVVASIGSACKSVGVALLGGETAEHPGVMAPDQIDLAATALGVVEEGQQWGPDQILGGEAIIGLESPNLRSNGFSLVRSIIADRDLDEPFEGSTLGETLLQPSLLYASTVLQAAPMVRAGVHVTGGGLIGNLPRVLPPGLGAVIDTSSWPVPPIFSALAEWGEVGFQELYSVFNMGIGFCLLIAPEDSAEVLALTGGRLIGSVEPGSGVTLA